MTQVSRHFSEDDHLRKDTTPKSQYSELAAVVDRVNPVAKSTSRGTKLARATVIATLIPIVAFYLAPRIYDLVATPHRLDQAVVSANSYNPTLADLVEHEHVTLAAFDSLDKMNAALNSVLATDAAVNAELNTLIDQINDDLHVTLDRAGTNVTGLVASLDNLTAQVNSLHAPLDGATSALDSSTSVMGEILADARATAAHVHRARQSAEESANDLSGK
ncbi:hypothetical protein [Rhodococcus pyridinivorans]|uniref:hypothetical protein n=1 Tax=Rhodococcus pyridinivorans TaxID=103816 RepID=UPI0039B386EA